MSSSVLYRQIQQFYDSSSGLWEQVWGEHMHHGYYGPDGKKSVERRQAQIDLIEELLRWTSLQLNAQLLETNISTFLDIGCGIGGSTLYLAEKFQATGMGITLSPVQVARAKERAREFGLEPSASSPKPSADFLVADALDMPFADESFDLVWSLESGEHMPDKQKFLQECYRVLKKDGIFIMATWCHRPTDSGAGELTSEEQKHLQQIYDVYYLPYVISLPEYEAIARSCHFQNISVTDWSTAVAPFWNVVIGSAFNPAAIFALLRSGWTTIKGALALGLMSRGYQSGLIRYGLLCARK